MYVCRDCNASITGSDWREHLLQDGTLAGDDGSICSTSSATRRFALGLVRICYIDFENVTTAGSQSAGSVSCVGGHPLRLPHSLAHEVFTEVSLGSRHVCAIRAADEVAQRRAICWGTEMGDQFQQISNIPDAGLHSVCSGAYYTCAIVADGQARRDEGAALCWGESEIVRAVERGSKSRRLLEIACGNFAVCGLVQESGVVRIPRCYAESS